MPDEIWAALIGVAGALSGVWYGANLSRKAARDLLAQQARAEFASAFANTLLKLTCSVEEGLGQAMDILKEDYPLHLVAYIRLRSVLPKEQQGNVDHAWNQYTNDDKKSLRQEREFYRFSHVLAADSDEHQFMLAAKHINALLARTAA